MRSPNPGLDPGAALTDWQERADETSFVKWSYDCTVVTPLYGGGVRAGEVDQSMPIRATGIRGQLRFWWRLSCALSDPSDVMFERETAIWGGIGSKQPQASKVSVQVDKIRGLEVEAAFTYHPSPGGDGCYKSMPKEANWVEPYVAFPARGALSGDRRRIETPPHHLAKPGLGFRLTITLHPELSAEQRAEIQTALRWWASFGGVGARTRRGMGAVQVKKLDSNAATPELKPVESEEVAALGGELRTRSTKQQDAGSAWKESIHRLRDFRQKAGVGRNESSKERVPAGRSRWPEPDLIRRKTRQHSAEHKPGHPVETAYPRAAFGLPIVFKFKDDKKGDPEQQLLVPDNGDDDSELDRMASQLILRPYWDGSNWFPAALLIPGWEQALHTTAKCKALPDSSYPVWPSDSAERAELARDIPPMAGLGDDPLTAFMAFFTQ
ncbi:type III-B CRISPR module RAMP protein Cmr1 [Halorhodospira halochloris]|uniref:type III-B CRISPR module RAMP protein Cmr1 n=1 Tax=Halorhodospira halochloris TaxID=1052 RepID=UPI001EE7EDB7|nr:type III-B CRISPR module RAMP protein Cmr1 [Halorhodospira halochloris]MCG5531161.1 type III-B CRISPR module RAMP protein Cmr1 [Halorhodospira halochloris]